MDTFARVLGLALAFGFGTALVVYVVSRFNVSKLIWGAVILFGLAILSAIWSFISPNPGGWDDIIFMINAMIFAGAGVLYLIGLWIFNTLRKKR
jgi:hypothetical protein